MDNQIVVKEVINHTATNEAFTFSLYRGGCNSRAPVFDVRQQEQDPRHCHHHQHELFFDMDIGLPFTWADMSDDDLLHRHSDGLALASNARFDEDDALERSEYPPDGKEFEFHIAFSDSALLADGLLEALSPADDLFYKGQLLPLHLPPRQRMLQRLSSTHSSLTSEDEDEDVQASRHGDLRVDYNAMVAELINAERYSFHPYSRWNSLCREDEKRCYNGFTLQVRSPAPHIHDRGNEHDAFPDCYKDPALRIIQDDRRGPSRKAQPSSRRSSKSSVGCSVLLSSSRRLGCVEDSIACTEASRRLDLRRSKQAKRKGFPIVKLTAPASLLKSVFSSRELREFLVYRSTHHREYRNTTIASKERMAEEEDEEDGDLPNAPHTFRIREAHERDRILSRAKICIQKYMKRFKSMYIFLLQTHQEQSRNLLDSSSSQSMDAMRASMACSSSSRAKGIDRCMSPKAMRSTASSEDMPAPRSHRRRDSAVQANLMSINQRKGVITARIHNQSSAGRSNLLQEMGCRSVACIEVESPIQGAIAHCKQSSTMSTL